MNAIKYHRPDTPDRAIELATELGDEAAYLAGGQSLVNELKQRNADTGTEIIDISRFEELSYIDRNDNTISIGALTRHTNLLDSTVLSTHLPVLPEMVAEVADVQVRNLGTIGGNIARADPATDYPVLLNVLEATFHIKSSTGTRTIGATEFFTDYFETVLESGELLAEIEVPVPDSNTAVDFQKLATRAYLGNRDDGRGDLALVNVAVSLTFKNNECQRARIGVGAVQKTPVRAVNTQRSLEGTKFKHFDPGGIGEQVAAEIQPDTHDQRVSTEYKQTAIRTLVARAVRNCLNEVGGETDD